MGAGVVEYDEVGSARIGKADRGGGDASGGVPIGSIRLSGEIPVGGSIPGSAEIIPD